MHGPAVTPRQWLQFAEFGLLGIAAPEAEGGLGGDELDLVLVLEEMGRAALPAIVAERTAVTVPLLAEIRGGTLREEWLLRLAAGEVQVAIRLDSSPLVDGADTADLLLLKVGSGLRVLGPEEVRLTRQPSFDESRRLFSVEPKTAGRAVAELPDGALETAQLRAQLAAAAQLLGAAQAMLDMTVDYAKERTQFRRAIGSFQAVKHRLANALLAIELARPTVYAAAWALARRRTDRAASVSLAKLYANRAGDVAARNSLQVHGGIGFTAEYDLQLWLKRAKALELTDGNSEWHRARLATYLGL